MTALEARCPDCDRTELVSRRDSDPDDAVAVIFACPECQEGGDFDPAVFVDALGHPLAHEAYL